MFGKFVKLIAKPGKIEDLRIFLTNDAHLSQGEAGTLRFDIWRAPGEPNGLYLYEAYKNAEAFREHQANDSYQRYINRIEPECVREECVLFDWTDSLGSNADNI